MDIETCIKYLNYVSEECDRHMRNGQVTDEELKHLIIELQRFKDKSAESSMPDEIKSKISDIELKYTLKGVERGYWGLALAIITFGAWAIFLHMRKQANRKHTLKLIKFDTSRLSSFIKMNY